MNKLSIKHLLFLSFIFLTFILTAQETKDNNELYSNLLNDKTKFKVKNLNINTENQDFGTVYYNDKIVFTSSRTNSKFIKRVWHLTNLPFLDLYVAEQKKSELVKVKPFNKNLNKKYHEGPASFNEAGTFMAFTRSNYGGKSKDDAVKLKLYTAKFENREWVNVVPMSFNSNEYSVGHPALTADGNTMYFASDMPGGFGGIDIYVTERNENGKWSTPMNLGININTKGNEMFPFICSNNLLFFASDGLGGHGGLDLFFVKKSEKGFLEPKNLGTSINSSKDDFAFILDKKTNAGYFSSDREEGKGDDDIYSFILLKPVKAEIVLKGKAVDINNNILANTDIALYNIDGNIIEAIKTDETGKYKFNIKPDSEYTLEAKKTEYKLRTLTVDAHTNETVIIKNLVLELIPEFNFICKVKDVKTKEPIENTKIFVNDLITGIEDVLYTDEKGEVLIKLNKYKLNDKLEFSFALKKESYSDKTVKFDTILHKSGNYILSIDMQETEIVEITDDIAENKPADEVLDDIVENKPVEILLKGKAVDKNNNALENADVTLYAENGKEIKAIKTNETGEYNFNIQPNSVYKLEAKKDEYTLYTTTIDSHVNDSVIIKDPVLEFVPEFSFVYKVTDNITKEPIPNIKITVNNLISGEENVIYTGDKGEVLMKLENFKLYDYLDYSLIFENIAYLKKAINFDTVLHKSGIYILNIDMQKAEIVESSDNIAEIKPVDEVLDNIVEVKPVEILLKGKSVDNNNNILANADVILYAENGNEIKAIKTNETGEFKFYVKPDSNYKLEANKSEYKLCKITVNSHTNDSVIIKDLVLELIPEFNFTCNVFDNKTKEPIANTEIKVNNLISGEENVLYTDDNGAILMKLDGYKLNDNLQFTVALKKESYYDKTVNYDTALYKGGDYILNIDIQKAEIVESSDDIEEIKPVDEVLDDIIEIKPLEILLKGKSVDNNNNILANADVILYDDNGTIIKAIKTNETGEFKFIVKPDSDYKLEGKKAKYKTVSVPVNSIIDQTHITQDLVLASLHDFNFIFCVTDKRTKEPIANTKISIDDITKGDKNVLYTDEKGVVALKFDKYKLNDNPKFEVVSEKEFFIKKTINYEVTLHTDGNYVYNIEMYKIEIGEDLGKLMELNPIYFGYDNYTISQDAAVELDKIVTIMNQYPNMVIELSSHTDCRGESSYNMDLSEKRANASADYIKKGITNPLRIYGKGYGEIRLVNDCDCDENNEKDCSEEEHQENRRTEFKIIKK